MTLETQSGSARAGLYVRQLQGDMAYKAFIPRPLPPDPPLNIDADMLFLLSEADRAMGRLDASAYILPNPDLFVRMYVTKEALLSSQIEGTQASLVDVLEYEAAPRRRAVPDPVSEVSNYVKAMNYGLDRVKELPPSNRLIREIHAVLLERVRGQERSPGEFRQIQNWVGAPGSDLNTAEYIPPPAHEMEQAMGQLEQYLHLDDRIPVLLKAGLVHSQFETIHPFLDGNGRMGRLLITFLLCQKGALARPLLYLSAYFKEHRQEYYDRLQAVRDSGDFEAWLRFFLGAVLSVANDAAETPRKILDMREGHRRLIQERMPGSANGLRLLDHLYQNPIIQVKPAAQILGVSYPTANNLVADFVRLGILNQVAKWGRDRIFRYGPYIDLLRKGTELQ